MTPNPLEHVESLHIGIVDYVSPSDIQVTLDIEAPESVALNTGTPYPFPRVNGYVLIPNDEGFLVGQVRWLTVERSAYPKRRGMKDFGLVDLPYPLRKLSVNPLGTLLKELDGNGKERNKFRRGVDAFPSVGDSVLIPTQKQLRDIIESGENRRVKIGTSPLAGNADVCVDPDRLFGRHLAVLGNTGSGKSCSVAGLIRWSLEEAAKTNETPNARFIVLDPNGEYERAFGDKEGPLKPRIFKVGESIEGAKHLKVPLWFWNSAEWASFTKASPGAQRPALLYALRMVRDGKIEPILNPSNEMRRFLRIVVSIITSEQKMGNPYSPFPKSKNFFELIKKWRDGGFKNHESFTPEESEALDSLTRNLDKLISDRSTEGFVNYVFSPEEINSLLEDARNAHETFGGNDSDLLPLDTDIPREFTGDSLLRSLDASAELLNVTKHVDTMISRIKTLLGDSKMASIVVDSDGLTLSQWLSDYIGDNHAMNGNIAIIDLSLVPVEIIHIITAITARMIFEALQRYRKHVESHKVLPTVLVMEEAHTYVKRYKTDSENPETAAICCQVFEKIAREGRKFGLGLVLSSQRPSELSPTVLSQCNSFLLHRISNDRDQDLVNRYVPDNLRGLLDDLPSLPSQNAILLGWASELPVLVRMNDLPKIQQPQSDDPDFWKVWTGEETRDVDWEEIARIWQERDNQQPEEEGEENDDGI